MGNPPVP